MKLSYKLMLGFGLLWAVFLFATIMALFVLKQQSASLEDAFVSNFNSVDYCTLMTDSIDSQNRLAMESLATAKSIDPAAIADLRKDFARGAAGQRRNITLPGEDQLTATAFARSADFDAALNNFMQVPADQHAINYREKLFPAYSAARDAIHAVDELNFVHLRSVNADLQKNLSGARNFQLLFAAVGAASAIASIVVLRKTILGPLHSLTSSVREVETGNLDLAVPVRTRDELGELAVAFNSMAARLREYRQLDSARLQRTQQTTQLAIDSLPDAVAVINPHGLVEISNHQARVHFGLIPGEKRVADLPVFLRELFEGPLRTGRSVEPQGYQSAVQLFDNGQERFLLPRAVPMFNDAGSVIGVVLILVDVTRLRRADEIKSCLVSTVSHELKTPLAAARFSAHLLAKETVAPLDAKQRKLVHAACEGTDRLHHIIEDLLQFQRFEEGRQMVRLAAVAPNTIIERALQELQPEFIQHQLAISTRIERDLPAVNADADLVNHVLTNLLSNAIKFVPAGGKVEIGAALDGEKIRFWVSDNGPGIPQEHWPQLFSRFYRAAAPAGTSGAGLGLSIARQLIEAQGGSIEYRPSEVLGGASFTFALPPAATPAPITT